MNQKIKDDAREKIRGQITTVYGVAKDFAESGGIGVNPQFDEWAIVDQILSLSGETDEVCERCEGLKQVVAPRYIGCDYMPMTCPYCNGTGTIKKKWHYGPIDENGREII